MKREHIVTFYYPGIMVAEEGSETISHRDHQKVKVPKNAYAFKFHDKVTRYATCEDGEAIEHITKQNESNLYYPNGKIYSEADVAAMSSRNGVLLDNMRSNEWKHVIKTRVGWWQPLRKDDVVFEYSQDEGEK